MSGRSVTWLRRPHHIDGHGVVIVVLFHSAFIAVGASADYATRLIEELISGPAAPLIPVSVVVMIVMVICLTRGPQPCARGSVLPRQAAFHGFMVRGARG